MKARKRAKRAEPGEVSLSNDGVDSRTAAISSKAASKPVYNYSLDRLPLASENFDQLSFVCNPSSANKQAKKSSLRKGKGQLEIDREFLHRAPY